MGATIQSSTTETIAGHVSALERALLDPSIRTDPERVADLLSDDFVEFGSSGHVWTKATTIAGLAAEDSGVSVALNVTDVQVRLLAAEAALVTYVVSRKSPGEAEIQTLRSSVWKREDGNWRMLFHQGTHRKGEDAKR